MGKFLFVIKSNFQTIFIYSLYRIKYIYIYKYTLMNWYIDDKTNAS